MRKDTRPERPDRYNKRQLAAFIDEDVFREFKILAAEQCTTTDGLVTKAVALLFDNYKKPIPAALKKKLSALGLGSLAIIFWVVTLAC